jgi:uncharacterized protein YbjT (DUF2867 family)
MKIVVIGGGVIGSKLVRRLRENGHDAVAASPDAGVDILTGEGLADALASATVVIDVAVPPSVEDAAAREFFETSTRNLLAAEAAAGVGHHVALSAVGIERLQHSGYFRAKSAQEKLIENSAIPYSIVHATQFQPMAEDDAVQAVARISVGPPLNAKAEVAGPDQFRMDEFFRSALATRDDPRTVVTDPHASFFGAELGEQTLLPGADAVLGQTRCRNWPGRTPSGDNAFLHELELYVRTELTLAETSQPPEETVNVPIGEWMSDPADDQRYETSLRSLLGAVEALEDGSGSETEGW